MTWTRLSILSTAAALLLAAAPAPPVRPQAAAAPPAPGARVRLTVTITDEQGRYVTLLGRDKLTVLDEKVPQEPTSFEQPDEPMSIGLVLDLSRDDRAALLSSAKAAVSDFVSASGPDHRYFIVGFDGEAHLAADWARTPAEVSAGFARLADVKPSRKAALYDALHAALSKVGTGPHPKRALILISDGRNDGSKLKRDELFDAVRRSDALLYAVGVKRGGANLVDPSDQPTLDRLCASSGGFASPARTQAEFRVFFERLSVELKNQYAVSFAPAEAGPDGAWRRLSYQAKPLELKRSPSAKGVERIRLSARGREGYYYRREGARGQ